MRLFERKEKDPRIELTVLGMACEHCEMRVRNALLGVDGVQRAEVSHVTGQALVTLADGADVSPDQLVTAMAKAVQAAGYEVDTSGK